MKHISAALQMESMIPEQMRKENIRRIGINSVLFFVHTLSCKMGRIWSSIF